MNEFKGTRGPWHVEQIAKWPFDIRIVSADGEVVSVSKRSCYSTKHKDIEDVMNAIGFAEDWKDIAIRENETQLANEILKSAAPDLFEACMRADQQMELAAECVEAGRYDEAILHLRSLSRGRREAIKKALGD